MTEVMKELMPVIKEAISAGKAIGIWYIIAITIIPFIKSLVNWTFVLVIAKGIYTLLLKGMENEKSIKKS